MAVERPKLASEERDPIRNPFIREMRWFDADIAEVAESMRLDLIPSDARAHVHAQAVLSGKSRLPGFQSGNCLAMINGKERILYFFGQPVARSIELTPQYAEFAWHALRDRLLRRISNPGISIRKNEATSSFSFTLYQLLSLVVPFRRAHVFETNCERGGQLVYKYRLMVEGGDVVTTRTDGDTSFGKVRKRTSTDAPLKRSAVDGISAEAFFVSRIAELITHKAGPPLSLRALDLIESDAQYVAIELSGVELDVIILTDSAETRGLSRLSTADFGSLMTAAGRPVLDRIAYLKNADAVRSQVRHALAQSNEHSEGIAKSLINRWHEISDVRGIGPDFLETLKQLGQQIHFTQRRIDEVGVSPVDVFGCAIRREISRGTFSIYHRGTDGLAEVDLLQELKELVGALRQERRDLNSRFDFVVCEVTTDRSALRTCLTEVIENARKYSDGTSPVRIEASKGSKHGTVSVRIINSGLRIGRNEWKHILDFGIRGRAAMQSGRPGTGGGLSMVRDTAKGLGLDFSFQAADAVDFPKDSTYVAEFIFPSKLVIRTA